MGKSERHFGTNDEWCTEPAVYEPILRVWGRIGFDPCHSPASRVPAFTRVWSPHHLASLTARAPMIGTLWGRCLVGDGLQAAWTDRDGPLFDNCPYSDIGPWARKHAEARIESFLYIPARTGAGYYTDYIWPTARAVCFLMRGQKFEQYGVPALNQNPKSKSFGKPMQTPWHSVINYWGDKLDKFRAAYQDAGRVVVL
jgi:hypothetical protein